MHLFWVQIISIVLHFSHDFIYFRTGEDILLDLVQMIEATYSTDGWSTIWQMDLLCFRRFPRGGRFSTTAAPIAEIVDILGKGAVIAGDHVWFFAVALHGSLTHEGV